MIGKFKNYSNSKATKALSIAQIELIQLDGKVADYIINGYPRCGESYDRLGVEPRGSKFINCRCISFSESNKRNKSKDLGMKILETMTGKTHFEVKFIPYILVVVKKLLNIHMIII